mmetsp:Transcript_109478/g.290821  ORF Transcript_109478/g.290821 Transcript_109478/m.290821 type:complete len:400 (+) Transcript_109478:551-1750(+)
MVVPPDVGNLLAADPAPLARARARHVVAAGHLLGDNPALRALPRVHLRECLSLLFQDLSLVLGTGFRPDCVGVAVVVAELATTLVASHLGDDRRVCLLRVLPVWLTELVAVGACPEAGVAVHPHESSVLPENALAHPRLDLAICYLGRTTIAASAWAPKLGDATLLYTQLDVHRHAIGASAVGLATTRLRHNTHVGRHGLQADVAPLHGHDRGRIQVDAMPIQRHRDGPAQLRGPEQRRGVCPLQEALRAAEVGVGGGGVLAPSEASSAKPHVGAAGLGRGPPLPEAGRQGGRPRRDILVELCVVGDAEVPRVGHTPQSKRYVGCSLGCSPRRASQDAFRHRREAQGVRGPASIVDWRLGVWCRRHEALKHPGRAAAQRDASIRAARAALTRTRPHAHF